MRISMPTTSYPASQHDAAGRFVRVLARALVRRGHVIEVLAPELHDVAGDPGDPGILVHRVPYVRPRTLAQTFGGHGVPDNVRLDARAWLGAVTFPLALGAAIARRHARWDAMISHWAIPSALALAPFREGRPHVAVLHGSDAHLLRALPRPVRMTVARAATTLVFVSDDLRRALGDLGGTPIVVQPMGIDVAETHGTDRLAARERMRFTGPTVLAMSRLVPIKGLERAIAAMEGLDATLVIAGDGPERARLEALAHQTRARVRFLGVVSGRARLDALAGADVFVAPSRVLAGGRSEGTPTAVLEALAAGLPVIASRAGGIGEVVTHEVSGLLSEAFPRDLARDLRRVLDDDALRARLGAGARMAAVHHDVDRVAARFERWLEGAQPSTRQGSTVTVPAGTSSASAASGTLDG